MPGPIQFSGDGDLHPNQGLLNSFHFQISDDVETAEEIFTCEMICRFSEVAQLLAVCWLEIKGKFKTSMLSSNTTYAAYLVYNIGLLSCGLDFPAKTLVRHVDGTEDVDDDVAMTVVYLKPRNPHTLTERIGGVPQKRTDGWMEIELGKFYNDRMEGELDIRFTETCELRWKSGLVVEGIDIRPTNEGGL